jgi:hypothetical protein
MSPADCGPDCISYPEAQRVLSGGCERNILAGGDSAGRSILIGAVMAHVHGVATETGIPLSWVLQMEDGPSLWQECEMLASSH